MALTKFGNLTQTETVVVIALSKERQKAVDMLSTIDAAIKEQVTSIASRQGLPPQQYHIMQGDDGNLQLVTQIPDFIPEAPQDTPESA